MRGAERGDGETFLRMRRRIVADGQGWGADLFLWALSPARGGALAYYDPSHLPSVSRGGIRLNGNNNPAFLSTLPTANSHTGATFRSSSGAGDDSST